MLFAIGVIYDLPKMIEEFQVVNVNYKDKILCKDSIWYMAFMYTYIFS
jgi:hypothetical protein